MRRKRTGLWNLFATGAVALACCASLATAADSMSISQELDVNYLYVGGARTRGAGLNVGQVDENSADVRYVVSPQLTKDVLLRVGLEWQRFSFGVPGNQPVPTVLQQVSAVLGFDYAFADQWLMRVEVQPGVYGDFHSVRWDDVDAPLILGAVSLLSGLKALETQLIFEVRLIEFRGMLSKSLQNGGFLEEGDAQNL
mgnify:CR=1 FL=1